MTHALIIEPRRLDESVVDVGYLAEFIKCSHGLKICVQRNPQRTQLPPTTLCSLPLFWSILVEEYYFIFLSHYLSQFSRRRASRTCMGDPVRTLFSQLRDVCVSKMCSFMVVNGGFIEIASVEVYQVAEIDRAANWDGNLPIHSI